MSFQLSPGIEIQERDLTNIVPAVATTAAGFVGNFLWGPVNERILVDSEKNLRLAFGNPADPNTFAGVSQGINAGATDFLTASSFLGYGNNLQIVRAVNLTGSNTNANTARNANASGSTSAYIFNEDSDETYGWEAQFGSNGFSSGPGMFAAKYPGALGNSIYVSICDNLGSSTAEVYRFVGATTSIGTYEQIPDPDPQNIVTGTTVGLGVTLGLAQANTDFTLLSKRQDPNGEFVFYIQAQAADQTNVDSLFQNTTATDVYVYFGSTAMRIVKDSDGDRRVNLSASTDLDFGTAFNVWEWENNFEGNPSTSSYASSLNGTNDEFHIVVYDGEGKWTGTRGTVLERFPYVSKAKDAKKADGTSNYWADVLRENSQYIWAAETSLATNIGSDSFSDNAQNNNYGRFGIRDFVLSGGSDGRMPDAADYVIAYNTYFSDPETVDVQLLVGNGATTETDAKTIADALISIADARRDCVAFISPSLNDVTGSTPMNDIIEFRNRLSSTSYAVIDTGWKKKFDAYNDQNVYVPLSADLAGLCVRTDRLADAWFSPAGYNRGQIRNVVKLAYNPSKAERDRLYTRGINPVISEPGQGTVLFGDKTMLSRPSAFDRINVRRLFIVLEKAIATASKYILFELNDEFTRAQFRNLVEPFLRDVQGRGGITDFRVVADETNNTPTVIDSNNFVADIYIKPARSINFIQLNFIATPTGISFEEAGA